MSRDKRKIICDQIKDYYITIYPPILSVSCHIFLELVELRQYQLQNIELLRFRLYLVCKQII